MFGLIEDEVLQELLSYENYHYILRYSKEHCTNPPARVAGGPVFWSGCGLVSQGRD